MATKTSDDEPTLSQSVDPVTSTPNPSNTDATKRKHGEITSVSSCDSSVLDLNSDEVRLKIKSIVEESVRVATDAAINAAIKAAKLTCYLLPILNLHPLPG